MNYILLSLNRADLTISELHLFEHYLSEKVLEMINDKFYNDGLIINSETFLDYMCIQIFYSNSDLKEKLITEINDINYYDKDVLDKNISIIKNEVNINDLTDEDKILYSPLESFGENINNLYDAKFTSKNYNALFENEKINLRLFTFNDGVFCNYRKNRGISHDDKDSFVTYKIENKKEWITGYINFPVSTIENLLEGLLLSFMLGKSSESYIYESYLKKYDLYLGYSIEISLHGSLLILIISENSKNNQSQIRFASFEEKFSRDFSRYKEAFKTYLLYTDPYLVEFCRLSLSTIEFDSEKSTFTFNDIYNLIDQINPANIFEFFERKAK